MLRVDFFFNDTATTEIYTYGPTLSRHDALPIDVRFQRASGILFANCLGSLPDTHLEYHGIGCGLSGFRSRQALHCSTGCGIRQKRTFREVIRRSEEHTSELQSLMRISYAAFCLKQKIYIQ